MPTALYDGVHAPTPWVLRSQYSEERGMVVHWIEDAIGGVTVPDVSHLDGFHIVTAVNAYAGPQPIATAPTKDEAAILGLAGGTEWMILARTNYGWSSKHSCCDDYVDQEPTHWMPLPPPLQVPHEPAESTPCPTTPPVDLETLATNARALAIANGWDGSWSRTVAHGQDVKPGPMSKERWAEFTEAAQKAMEQSSKGSSE